MNNRFHESLAKNKLRNKDVSNDDVMMMSNPME